ncbi:phosphotransferase [Streptomyces chartreusis]|uniref:phosphotransferase n=1 Tax=Streptomyces chartreusis TaxID=1969 RepID=UPI00365BFD04
MGRPVGRLLGAGRTADVYELDEAWVLRRDREGWGDALAEGAVMAHVRDHGYPAPGVRLADSSGTDLVMQRLAGPTMLGALSAGIMGAEEAGGILARLLRQLHDVPARKPGDSVLHLDLHPDNVILTTGGPYVIDWNNTEEGDPGLDWGTSAVILAQVAVGDEPIAEPTRAILAALLTDPSHLTDDGLREALRRRVANPTMTPTEVELLGEADELIRSFMLDQPSALGGPSGPHTAT